MDYQITCVCGHRFLVSQDKVNQTVICPACQQRLSPVVHGASPGNAPALPAMDAPDSSAAGSATANHAPAEDAVAAAAEETKRCPFCGEVILAIAKKCKHCGEFLDHAVPAVGPAGAQMASTASAPTAANPQSSAADVPPAFILAVSQWDNFWKWLILATIVIAVSLLLLWIRPLRQYAAIGIPAALVFAGFIGWYLYLATRNTRFVVRPLRIDTEQGILTKDVNSLELFRIVHVDLKQGLIERLLGIGTIKLMTADSEEPKLILYQIPHVRQVHKYIQAQIPIAARQRGAIYMEK